jgi:hypothetical protein
MAKFSMKVGGKEIAPASVYAPPHTMTGSTKVKLGNGYDAEPAKANGVNMSVGNIDRAGYSPEAKTTGIKMRGTGAATKGTMSRGPMA